MTTDTLEAAREITLARGDSPWRQAWRRLGRRPAALVGLAVILFFFGIALAAPLVSPHNPIATDWLAWELTHSALWVGIIACGRLIAYF